MNEDLFKSIYLNQLHGIDDALNEATINHAEILEYDVREDTLRSLKKKVHLSVNPIKQIRDIQYMNDLNKINKINE